MKMPQAIALVSVLALACIPQGVANSKKEMDPAAKTAPCPAPQKEVKKAMVPRSVEAVPAEQQDSKLHGRDVSRADGLATMAKKFSQSKNSSIIFLGAKVLLISPPLLAFTGQKHTAAGGEQFELAQQYRSSVDALLATKDAKTLLELVKKLSALEKEINYVEAPDPAAKS